MQYQTRVTLRKRRRLPQNVNKQFRYTSIHFAARHNKTFSLKSGGIDDVRRHSETTIHKGSERMTASKFTVNLVLRRDQFNYLF